MPDHQHPEPDRRTAKLEEAVVANQGHYEMILQRLEQVDRKLAKQNGHIDDLRRFKFMAQGAGVALGILSGGSLVATVTMLATVLR